MFASFSPKEGPNCTNQNHIVLMEILVEGWVGWNFWWNAGSDGIFGGMLGLMEFFVKGWVWWNFWWKARSDGIFGGRLGLMEFLVEGWV